MNRGELRSLVYTWLDDQQGINTNSGGYFTSTQVNTWLNNAQIEVYKRLVKAAQNYYTKCVQTTMVINQRDYALPEDFKKVMRLEVVVSGVTPNEATANLLPITTNQRDIVLQGTGTPNFYTILRNKIDVRPAPTLPYVMRMIYTRSVTEMVSDLNIPDVPSDYQELVALYAARDGFIKDGRVSDLLEKKIMIFEKDMDTDDQERNQDVPRQIIDTGVSVNEGFYW